MTSLQGASKGLPPVQRERLSEGDIMYCVYWVHLEIHSHNEGYIGITKDFKERKRSHKKNRKKTKLTCAISRYSDELIWEVLHDNLSLEEALSIEKEYRPFPDIGWNHQTGGELGVDTSWYEVEENRNRHSRATSLATKAGIANNDTPEKRSERAKENWKKNRESYSKVSKGQNNSRALLKEDQVREIKYSLLKQGMSDKEIASLFNVKPYVISFIRKKKNWKHV